MPRATMRLRDSDGRQMHVTGPESQINKLITGISETHRDIWAERVHITVQDSPEPLDLDRMTVIGTGKL